MSPKRPHPAARSRALVASLSVGVASALGLGMALQATTATTATAATSTDTENGAATATTAAPTTSTTTAKRSTTTTPSGRRLPPPAPRPAERSDELVPLVRRPLRRPGVVGPARPVGALGPRALHPGPGAASPGQLAPRPPPVPRRPRRGLRRSPSRRPGVRLLGRDRPAPDPRALHLELEPPRRVVGRRRPLPPRRRRGHVAAALPDPEAVVEGRAHVELRALRGGDDPHAHRRHRPPLARSCSGPSPAPPPPSCSSPSTASSGPARPPR